MLDVVTPPQFQPLVEELPPGLTPREAFRRLCRLPHCLFLDSALADGALADGALADGALADGALADRRLGRYSFVAADPFDYLQLPADGSDGLGQLARRMEGLKTATVAGLPPFQGGAAGLFGYELGRSLERLPVPAVDEFEAPALAVGLYDLVAAFDHLEGRAWIISQGFPQLDPGRRRRRAARRLDRLRSRLLRQPAPEKDGFRQEHHRRQEALPAVSAARLAPQYPVQGPAGLTSNFSEAKYLGAIERAIAYVHSGDVFQVNLAQRLLRRADEDPVSLYLRLRECNPAPFAGYFDTGDFQIVSASPERFLQVCDGRVETRPIKGTRQRPDHRQTDYRAELELRQSEKDKAENVMIVDLLRNDLSRVCLPESVHVSQLCQVEAYQYVLHLVSAVRGTLRGGLTPVDLVRAAFPGGSVTGAPKVRAMEIIAELEGVARGAYCGSLGYLGFDGSLDLSILIRTITAGRGWWQAPVGGGIVAQSVPRLEYEETWHKAEGLIRAFP